MSHLVMSYCMSGSCREIHMSFIFRPLSFYVRGWRIVNMAADPSALHPATDSCLIPFILFSKYFFQFALFNRDHDPVDIGHSEGQENHRPNLPQDSCLSKIRESETDIHRIPAET